MCLCPDTKKNGRELDNFNLIDTMKCLVTIWRTWVSFRGRYSGEHTTKFNKLNHLNLNVSLNYLLCIHRMHADVTFHPTMSHLSSWHRGFITRGGGTHLLLIKTWCDINFFKLSSHVPLSCTQTSHPPAMKRIWSHQVIFGASSGFWRTNQIHDMWFLLCDSTRAAQVWLDLHAP